MKVLLLSYMFDGTDVGEPLMAFKWAKVLADRVDLTLLSFERPTQTPLRGQLPDTVNIVTWPEPDMRSAERLNAMMKPAYPLLFRHVKRWLRDERAAGREYDVAHQIMPLAARYPCPFQGESIPYIMGPLGGTLPTVEGFSKETGSARWFTRLRAFDDFRFRHDPWLRRSYREASVILGVAPYMADRLASIDLQGFEAMLELGIEDLPPMPAPRQGGGLRLLHVGRGVRTKGLRDVVRALALLKDLPDITLTSAGDGEEIELCRQEAETLGVADRVTFLGRIPHAQVNELYQSSDIFTFPSFREPTGGVLYEAMRWGLPIVTVDYGGPGFIVDDATGIRLPLSTPEALARDLAQTIQTLYHDPDRRRAMGQAARKKLENEGLWERKAERLTDLYQGILDDAEATPREALS